MNVIRFIGFEGLTIQVALIAAIVFAAETALKKFSARVPNLIANWLPLLVSLILTALVNLISGDCVFCENTLYEALLSYSFGTIAAVALSKIIRGEVPQDAFFMLIQGITEGILKENSAAEMAEIAKALKNSENTNTDDLKERIVLVLKKAAKDGVSQSEIAAIAELILQSAKTLKKEK